MEAGQYDVLRALTCPKLRVHRRWHRPQQMPIHQKQGRVITDDGDEAVRTHARLEIPIVGCGVLVVQDKEQGQHADREGKQSGRFLQTRGIT